MMHFNTAKAKLSLEEFRKREGFFSDKGLGCLSSKQWLAEYAFINNIETIFCLCGHKKTEHHSWIMCDKIYTVCNDIFCRCIHYRKNQHE